MNIVNEYQLTENNLFNQHSDDSAWNLFTEGLNLFRKSQHKDIGSGKKKDLLKEVVRKFTHFILLVPEYTATYYYLGISYYQLGKYNLSLKAFNEAILRHGKTENYNLYLYRGRIYALQSDLNKAFYDFNYVINNFHNNRDAYYNRALLYMLEEKWDEAISDLTNAINLGAETNTEYSLADVGCIDEDGLRIMRAECYYRKGKYVNAMDDYAAVLEKTNDSDVMYKWGECCFFAGEYDFALLSLTEVIEADPYNYDAYFTRGNVYIALSGYEFALEDYTQAIKLLLNNTKAFIRRAYVHSKLGNYTEALKDLESAKKIDPSDPELNRIYGKVFLAMHMEAKAKEHLRIAAGQGDKLSKDWLSKMNSP